MAPRADIEALAGRLAKRDPAAFREFDSTFGPKIYRYLRNKGLPDADADDLTATLITDIELKADKYRFSGSFKNWVFRIVRNAWCDWSRENGTPIATLDEEISTADLYEGEFATNPEVDRIVQAAEARLPPLEREILQLRYHGVADTFEEIGRYLGMNPATIRTRHSRALKKLDRMLKNHPLIQARNSYPKRIEVSRNE